MGYDDQIQFHFNQKAIKLKALNILTADKSMVAMSDYDDYHKTVERNILTSVLGPTARKKNRVHRDVMAENVLNQLQVLAASISYFAANREDVESIYVSDLGATMTKEIFKVLVTDPTMGAIEYVNVGTTSGSKDTHVSDSYCNVECSNQEKPISLDTDGGGKVDVNKAAANVVPPNQRLNSYIDYLLLEVEPLTKKQLLMSVWESINEASDTTMITTEWAMYELAKNPKQEARLYEEIQNVCESEKITEEKLCKIPYLSAIFHETLRKHSPVSIILLRYVHENTEVGGEIWENPEEWNPERFLKENEPIDLLRTMSFGAGK
ncbi:ent-kaurene oxidase-like 5 [Artemisia annua]|uniref:Ent-kaurene oxidase-like 5 n=1 Tax=Artemisia annua TaxID=35608 RepID=A0A2U1M0D1_ARTAN|nr:ent-kaurene oxidase-like 5 [Artemisia annua]